MAASAWYVFYSAKKEILDGTIDLDNDTIKMALLASGWGRNIAADQWSDLESNEIAAGNGYDAGGKEITGKAVVLSAGNVAYFDSDNTSWIATGGPIVARYAVLYDDSTANKTPICYCYLDTTTDVTVNDGLALVVQLAATGYFYLG